jgi:hypothetical protein
MNKFIDSELYIAMTKVTIIAICFTVIAIIYYYLVSMFIKNNTPIISEININFSALIIVAISALGFLYLIDKRFKFLICKIRTDKTYNPTDFKTFSSFFLWMFLYLYMASMTGKKILSFMSRNINGDQVSQSDLIIVILISINIFLPVLVRVVNVKFEPGSGMR